MESSIVVAGFGGQGVLFAGQLLAYAGMESGKFVTWIPSYGPEMRGGTAHCVVIIGDEPIGSPIVANPDIVLALNQPSYEKYLPLVKPDGLLVVNSSLVDLDQDNDSAEVVAIAANEIAERHGSVKMLNMAAVGAMLARRPVLPLEAIEQAITGHMPRNKQHMVEANLAVLREGFGVPALRSA